MNKVLVAIVILFVMGALSFAILRERAPEPSEPIAPATAEPKSSAQPQKLDPLTAPVDEAPQPVASTAPFAPAPVAPQDADAAERRRRADIEAQWSTAWGTASKAELEKLIEQFRPGARQLREDVFAQFADRAETTWVEEGLDAFAVEQRFPRPGTLAVAHFVELDKPSQKARFDLLYVTPQESRELADMERLFAWLAERVKAADH